MDPVAQVELGQDVAHVGLRGGLADEECARDLEVRRALREQLEDLALACGELGEGGREVILAPGEPGERLDDATGDEGASTASPSLMTWIAAMSCSGEASVSRKPLAPARSPS